MKTAKLALLLLSLGMIGCGSGSPLNTTQTVIKDPLPVPSKPHVVPQQADPKATPQEEQKPATPEEKANAAKNAKLTCEFEGECEPALALISIATPAGLSRCTGFLISDHEVMTNDHCMDDVPAAEEACQGMVYTHFTGDVHRACKRISIRSHQTGINSKDYAVIELDQPVLDREALAISKRGFNNLEMAEVYSVQVTRDTANNTYNGIQVKRKCQASYSTLMNINITSSKESLMTFGDCAIQEGNSGSPMINASGEVGAMVQGFLTVKEDGFSDLLQPYLLDGSYGEVAIATQTRCMPELVGNTAKSCEAVKPLSALYPKDYMESYGGWSERFLPRATRGTYWNELKSQDSTFRNFVALPNCISAEDAHASSYGFTANALSYHQGINARLQAEWRSLYRAGEKQTFFQMEKSSETSPSVVSFVSHDFGKVSVPLCSR